MYVYLYRHMPNYIYIYIYGVLFVGGWRVFMSSGKGLARPGASPTTPGAATGHRSKAIAVVGGLLADKE